MECRRAMAGELQTERRPRTSGQVNESVSKNRAGAHETGGQGAAA